MKALILTAKCGMGHYNCAKAIEKILADNLYIKEIKFIDIYEEKFGKKASVFYKIYDLLVDYGNALYNLVYNKAVVTNENENILNLLYDIMVKDFTRIIEKEKTDLVISTYSLTSEIMSTYKEKTGSKIPLITWITDIKPHSGWINSNTDIYIAPDIKTKNDLENMGVRKDIIEIGGIPLLFKNEEIIKEKTQKRQVLLMGGGLGILPKNLKFYKKLNEMENVETTVVTGKNKSLYTKLYGKFENIKVLGYVNNVEELMRNSDLLITKPGGVTTFEGINTETPLIVFKANLEQEIHNAKFIEENNIGKVLPFDINKGEKNLLEIINIIKDEKSLNKMKENLKNIKNQIDSDILEDVIFRQWEEKCS